MSTMHPLQKGPWVFLSIIVSVMANKSSPPPHSPEKYILLPYHVNCASWIFPKLSTRSHQDTQGFSQIILGYKYWSISICLRLLERIWAIWDDVHDLRWTKTLKDLTHNKLWALISWVSLIDLENIINIYIYVLFELLNIYN